MSTSSPPREWVDSDTGYRVVRLSDEPGSSSLYFNENGFTPEGDFLIISTPSGISKVNMRTLELSNVIDIDLPFRLMFTGHKYRTVYYETRHDGIKSIMRVNVDDGQASKITDIKNVEIQSINADETLLAGIENDPNSTDPILKVFSERDPETDQPAYMASLPEGSTMTHNEAKELRMTERFDAISSIEMKIFVIDTKTGVRRDIHTEYAWLNHLLFSPTDPNLLMYCHEGPWHEVDRLWTIRLDEDQPKPFKVHNRTMFREIAGHEWFSQDGKTIWYDLQTPRGEDFWVAGYEIDSGRRTWYHLERDEWSVHFHSSYDGTLFAGDGGEDWMVASAKGGKWLYLFTPRLVTTLDQTAPQHLVQAGVFDSQKLVNMKDQDYAFEPNVNFSPDGKWLIFRANMHGEIHTYAVDLKKEK